MKQGIWIVIYFMLLSCSYNATMYEKRNAMRACQASCIERQVVCNKQCSDNCTNCLVKAYNKASCKINAYRNEKRIMSGLLDRELNSYRDPLQCRKITCHCAADYDICWQSCTGVIHKSLRAETTCG